jgi:GNAT superfamily N-acetyltransferase
LKFEPITWLDWKVELDRWEGSPDDKFAWTFRAKADTLGLWDHAVGVKNDEGHIMSAIVVRRNKYKTVHNLQLLHTFSQYRGLGLARQLVETEFDAVPKGEYFRVSSEESAIPFYRRVGFKFWGAQKSGCLLSIFKKGGMLISDGIYDPNDKIIQAAVFSNRRGGVVHLDPEGAC